MTAAGTRPLRVLHLPTTVGGNPQGLARAERALGLDSHSLTFQQTVYQYPADEVLFDPADGWLRREAKRWAVLRRALRDYDVVHFNFGETLFPCRLPSARPGAPLARLYRRAVQFVDLRLLKRAGKAVFVTYQGDDARQGDYCRQHFEISPAGEVEPDYYSPETDARKRRMIRAMDRWADRIYALNPDLLHVLPARAAFLPYASVDLPDWDPAPRAPGAPPVVLHAPSHRGVKGTRFVLDAVTRLKAEGVPVELLLVEGLSHAEARRLYLRADLLVDQLLCGWYGALAVELMALGRPVVAYLREADLAFLPAAMRHELPMISATPASIYTVLRELLTARRYELPELGRRSRAYVERWHDPLEVARQLKRDYEAAVAAAAA